MVKVFNCKKVDVTRRDNSIVYNKTKDYENVNIECNYKNWLLVIGTVILLNFIILKLIGKKVLLKYL